MQPENTSQLSETGGVIYLESVRHPLCPHGAFQKSFAGSLHADQTFLEWRLSLRLLDLIFKPIVDFPYQADQELSGFGIERPVKSPTRLQVLQQLLDPGAVVMRWIPGDARYGA